MQRLVSLLVAIQGEGFRNSQLSTPSDYDDRGSSEKSAQPSQAGHGIAGLVERHHSSRVDRDHSQRDGGWFSGLLPLTRRAASHAAVARVIDLFHLSPVRGRKL